jgi:hypothetical protein
MTLVAVNPAPNAMGWLEPPRLLLLAVATAPLSVVATIMMSYAISELATFSGMAPNSVEDVANSGLDPLRVASALLVAPVVENFVCLVLLLTMASWTTNRWWLKPFLVAAAAATFHGAVFADIRPIAVLPGFFVMCSLIENAPQRQAGYWASVLHHSCINAVNLAMVVWATGSSTHHRPLSNCWVEHPSMHATRAPTRLTPSGTCGRTPRCERPPLRSRSTVDRRHPATA